MCVCGGGACVTQACSSIPGLTDVLQMSIVWGKQTTAWFSNQILHQNSIKVVRTQLIHNVGGYAFINLSKVNHHPTFKGSRHIVLCQIADFQNCKVGQLIENDTERKTGAFERESSHSKGPYFKKKKKRKTSCGHWSDTFINSVHVPHFLFHFEVMLEAKRGRRRQGGRERAGLSDSSVRSHNIPSGWSGSHSERPQ